MSQRRTIVEEALAIINALVRYCGDKSDIARGFRTRSRQHVADIAYHGLAFSIAVIASRSSARALEEALRGVNAEEFVKRVCTDMSYVGELGIRETEKRAYALYGFALLYILKRINATRSSDLASFVKESLANSLLESYAIETAMWIKRFAEAYIHV